MKNKKIVLLLISLIFITGCNSKQEYKGVVNVLNWSSYIPDEIIHDFENTYNIKVNYGTY